MLNVCGHQQIVFTTAYCFSTHTPCGFALKAHMLYKLQHVCMCISHVVHLCMNTDMCFVCSARNYLLLSCRSLGIDTFNCLMYVLVCTDRRVHTYMHTIWALHMLRFHPAMQNLTSGFLYGMFAQYTMVIWWMLGDLPVIWVVVALQALQALRLKS